MDVRALLALNESSSDKRQVAIKKILKHHQHFDMQPFFEWDLKLLPLAIDWFERARSIVGGYDSDDDDSYEDDDEASLDKRKLDAVYQLIRAMPSSFETVSAGGANQRKRGQV